MSDWKTLGYAEVLTWALDGCRYALSILESAEKDRAEGRVEKANGAIEMAKLCLGHNHFCHDAGCES